MTKRKRYRVKRDPGRVTSLCVSVLGVDVAFPEYRHDVIRVERDTPSHRLDDDGGEGFRYRGLLLLHREIRLVPFLGQVRYRVPASLLASFILAALALELPSRASIRARDGQYRSAEYSPAS